MAVNTFDEVSENGGDSGVRLVFDDAPRVWGAPACGGIFHVEVDVGVPSVFLGIPDVLFSGVRSSQE